MSKILFGSFSSYIFIDTFVLFTTDINLSILLKIVFISLLSIFSLILILYFSNKENNTSNKYFRLSKSHEATSIILVKIDSAFIDISLLYI